MSIDEYDPNCHDAFLGVPCSVLNQEQRPRFWRIFRVISMIPNYVRPHIHRITEHKGTLTVKVGPEHADDIQVIMERIWEEFYEYDVEMEVLCPQSTKNVVELSP